MTDATNALVDASTANDDNMKPLLDNSVKLAKTALRNIAKGDAGSFKAFVAYGEALNAGRALFLSNKEFGRWVKENGLDSVAAAGDSQTEANTINSATRMAAMWAASQPDQFAKMQVAKPSVRTVRGLHSAWAKHVRSSVKPLLDMPEGVERTQAIDNMADILGTSTVEIYDVLEGLMAAAERAEEAADEAASEAQHAADEAFAVAVERLDVDGLRTVIALSLKNPALKKLKAELLALKTALEAAPVAA
jgi:hypothetical protein